MIDGIAPLRSVRVADLSEDKKQRLWAWIKANDPATQAFMKSAAVASIAAVFPGTSPVLDIDYVKRALA